VESTAAALKAEKEAHDADTAAIAREFRAALRQRDEAVAELKAERADNTDRIAALERDNVKSSLEVKEDQQRLEMELSKVRRERDNFAHERDELRARIARMLDQQRDFLTGMAESAPTPTAPPPSRRESRPHVPPPAEPMVEPVTVKPVRVEPVRTSEKVIDYIEAEVVSEEPDGGIHLPRVRPMPVRPPTIRTAG
jgi:septal ring factor EnvC (AmiA/AmiB activator)